MNQPIPNKPVIELPVQHLEVMPEELEATFGPQWAEIVALIRRAASLTVTEQQQLYAAWDASRDAARYAARGATWDAALGANRGATGGAAGDATWDATRDATWDATRDATQNAAWYAARDAARNAATALCVRDLVGQHGFEQEHYDLLTGPWAQVIGPAHPDD